MRKAANECTRLVSGKGKLTDCNIAERGSYVNSGQI